MHEHQLCLLFAAESHSWSVCAICSLINEAVTGLSIGFQNGQMTRKGVIGVFDTEVRSVQIHEQRRTERWRKEDVVTTC